MSATGMGTMVSRLARRGVAKASSNRRALAWHPGKIPPSVLDERFGLLKELDRLKLESNREHDFKQALRDKVRAEMESSRPGGPVAGPSVPWHPWMLPACR